MPSAPGNSKPKWAIKIRLYTPSHSIRPKVLNYWNERMNWVKLIPVGNKKELLLELTLSGSLIFILCWLRTAYGRNKSSGVRKTQLRSLLRVITGPGRPRPAASAVRGRADLHAKKADVAARRSALRGRAVGPATWPEPPLLARSGH